MIQKFLDLSTGYITRRDRELIGEVYPRTIIYHEYGCFVHIDGTAEEFEENVKAVVEAGFSEHFVKVMRFAKDTGCWWINFDCDGTEIGAGGFPTFE